MIKPFKSPIYITRPLLPNFKDFTVQIKKIFDSKILTNNGTQLINFENELKKYLKAKNVSIFCNGTIALQLACKALNLKGEVITTPFTFPATTHALYFNNLKPIFCDIENETFNIDPMKIESLITKKTSAIMPVHVFGNPCNVNLIEKIAKKYNLKVIYDAAHCFGVKINNIPIGNFGDISMFSFHATKIFNTMEGGALIFNDNNLKQKLDLLKNFGIKNETEITSIGTNAKMNEIQAAFGNLLLGKVNREIEKRKHLSKIYYLRLSNINGIKTISHQKNITYNYQYLPILVDVNKYGLSRDLLYDKLKKYNVFSRRYFYPLCSQIKPYSNSDSSKSYKLTVAEKITKQILCLPLYGDLTEKDINKICDIISFLKN